MSDRQCNATAVFVLLSVAVLGYFGTIGSGFVSDDFVLVHRAATDGYFTSWGGEDGSTFFRPVTTLSYLSDFRIWGSNPAGFHLTNVLWHFFTGTAVFLLLLSLLKQSRIQQPCLFALLSSVLFLSLASHSESVAWVSGRTDVLATAFALFSIFFFYRYMSKPSTPEAVFAVVFFFLGLLAKESVIVTPLLWGALFVYSSSAGDKKHSRSKWLLAVSLLLTGVYLAFRIFPDGNFFSNMKSGGFLNISATGMAENLVRYSFRVFIPPLPVSFRHLVLSHPALVPATLFLLVVPLGIAVHRKANRNQKRLLVLLAGCFVISLLPVLSMKVSLFDTRSERFLYLPSVFASGFLTVAVASVFRKTGTAVVIFVVLTIIQGIFLHRSNENWRQAGVLCSRISESVSEYHPDSVFILAVPDSFHGAYVFRNGLNEAVAMFTGEDRDYTVYCKIGSYGDSLFCENAELPDLGETERTVITCVDGTMRRAPAGLLSRKALVCAEVRSIIRVTSLLKHLSFLLFENPFQLFKAGSMICFVHFPDIDKLPFKCRKLGKMIYAQQVPVRCASFQEHVQTRTGTCVPY